MDDCWRRWEVESREVRFAFPSIGWTEISDGAERNEFLTRYDDPSFLQDVVPSAQSTPDLGLALVRDRIDPPGTRPEGLRASFAFPPPFSPACP